MEKEKLEKWLYVYRKRYKFYNDISITLSVSQFLFSASGLSGFVFMPLAALSIGAGVIEIIDKSLKISERKEEYKQAYKFYKSMLNSLKVGVITESEILIREQDFIRDLKYFPL